MRRLVLFVAATVATAVIGTTTAGAGERPTTWTVVHHNRIEQVHFPDDICGPRANVTTIVWKTEVNHLTERADGTFHFVDFETLTYTADYDDPALPDLSGRMTNTFQANLTPGKTLTLHETVSERVGAIRISYLLRLTFVDGKPVVEKEVFRVTGCP